MRDFTLAKYMELLDVLKMKKIPAVTFEEYLAVSQEKFVILRHDVDRLPLNAVQMAETENRLGIRSSFHFRARTLYENPEAIIKIAALGHEVCYHYEDLQGISDREYGLLTRGRNNVNAYDAPGIFEAYEAFSEHLGLLREYYPVKVASMHGNPLSRKDNRMMWNYFDYRSLGIICEPYFDIDYSTVLYITDTGRSWNRKSVNVRDKVTRGFGRTLGEPLNERFSFSNTDEIIHSIENELLPPGLIISTHPQRWNSGILPWISELAMQSVKNVVKGFRRKIATNRLSGHDTR